MGAIQEKFPFDKDFQVALLSVLNTNREFLLTVLEILKPEYFEDRALSWTYSTMRSFYRKYDRPPEDFELSNELSKAISAKTVKEYDVDAFRKAVKNSYSQVANADYIRDQVVTFCRNQAMFKEILHAAEVIKSTSSTEEQVSELPVLLEEALRVGSAAQDLGTQFFADTTARLYDREMKEDEDRYPTGIMQLDDFMTGGLKPKQMGLVIGGTGYGKSIFMPYVGKRSFLDRRKVCHITLELSEEEVAERYDALITRTDVTKLITEQETVKSELGWWYGKYGDCLNIKFFPAGSVGVEGIENHVRMLRSRGFFPDVLLIDYEDLLKPPKGYNARHEELAATSRALKGLYQKLGVSGWTATQLNREGFNSDAPSMGNIAGAYSKNMDPDVVVIIGKTAEDAQNNQVSLFVGKNRNGYSDRMMKVSTAFNRMSFVDLSRTPYCLAEAQIDPPEDPPEEALKEDVSILSQIRERDINDPNA